MCAKQTDSLQLVLRTFTGWRYGAIVPLQVGGGEGGEGVKGQAVRAR